MQSMKVLALAGLMAGAQLVSAAAPSAAPDASQLKAAHDLLAAMQAEKLMRMTAGESHYSDDRQRQEVMAKLDKTPPEEIYRRLALPLAQLVSTETATEMTRFYLSDYGQRVLKQNYNSAAQLYPTMPTPTPAEKLALKQPAYLKADQELKAAEPGLHHAEFQLVTAIANGK
jgi:hypothetical protein